MGSGASQYDRLRSGGDTAMSGVRVNNVQDAESTAFDNTGTGLAANNVQELGMELDGRSIFLRLKIPATDVTVFAGYFAVWHSLRIKNNVNVRVESDAKLRIMG